MQKNPLFRQQLGGRGVKAFAECPAKNASFFYVLPYCLYHLIAGITLLPELPCCLNYLVS